MKIKATTLIEVIVALVIIMLVFAGSTMLYVQLMNKKPDKKYRLQKELLALATEIKMGRTIENELYEEENGIAIFQSCEPYTADSTLLHLKLEAMEGDNIIAIHEELFIKSKR